MPPSLISASSTASSSGSSAAKTSGASVPCASPGRGRRAAASRTSTERRRSRRARARRRAWTAAQPMRALMTPSIASASRDLVDREPAAPAASIFATCGANAGEEHDDVGGRAVGDDLAVGQHDHPVGHARRRTRRRGSPRRRACPRAASPRDDRREALLGRVVEAAGRLVEQQHPGAPVSCTASTRPSRCPSDRSRGCCVAGTPGSEPLEQRRQVPGGAPSRGRPARTRLATVARYSRSAGRLRHQPDRDARRRRCLDRRRPTVPAWRGPEPWSAQSSDDLPAAVATHERDDLAGDAGPGRPRGPR